VLGSRRRQASPCPMPLARPCPEGATTPKSNPNNSGSSAALLPARAPRSAQRPCPRLRLPLAAGRWPPLTHLHLRPRAHAGRATVGRSPLLRPGGALELSAKRQAPSASALGAGPAPAPGFWPVACATCAAVPLASRLLLASSCFLLASRNFALASRFTLRASRFALHASRFAPSRLCAFAASRLLPAHLPRFIFTSASPLNLPLFAPRLSSQFVVCSW
jgi:hypothetical protein